MAGAEIMTFISVYHKSKLSRHIVYRTSGMYSLEAKYTSLCNFNTKSEVALQTWTVVFVVKFESQGLKRKSMLRVHTIINLRK